MLGGLGSHFYGKEPQSPGIFLENYWSVVAYHTCLAQFQPGAWENQRGQCWSKEETEVGNLCCGMEQRTCCSMCDLDIHGVWKPLTFQWGKQYFCLTLPFLLLGRKSTGPKPSSSWASAFLAGQSCSEPRLPGHGNSSDRAQTAGKGGSLVHG